ncbi:MAG TPA: FAD-binding oxidoreductase [Candidatus Gallacutalibacter stercoravium]|nr:FAD-binding oxidoreductase [Candidatus Gallacutalibacter stercoravium]
MAQIAQRYQAYRAVPLWTAAGRPPKIYPWLAREESCQVCVVGGGLTGALCALRFAQAGVDTVLVAAGPVGYGATSRFTGVMQADALGGLRALSARIGADKAAAIYRQCRQAADNLEILTESAPEKCGFARVNSFLYTELETNMAAMREEYWMKKRAGFRVRPVGGAQAREQFSFDLENGVITEDVAVTVDPYRLTHLLVQQAVAAGARVYENSPVEHIADGDGGRRLECATRRNIKAHTVVLATGVDCEGFLKGCGARYTHFAVATAPQDAVPGLPAGVIATRTDHPMVTISRSPDGRILAEGVDSRHSPLGLGKSSRFIRLEETISDCFPQLHNTRAAYAFFCEYLCTKDRLPVIGEHADYPGCLFALCGGPAGGLFAEIASRLLLAHYQGDSFSGEEWFSPRRL